MNRITNAFSAAIPSSTSSDAGSIHIRDSPKIPSPLEPAFPTGLTLRTNSRDRRAVAPHIVYDDPRTIYFNSSSASSAGGDSRFASELSNFSSDHLSAGGGGLQRFGRPNMLRHLTDDGSGWVSGMSTPRAGSRSRERDRGVRVNLMAAATAAKRGWGMSSATGTTRINRMAEGPDGQYAVGGGQYLRVFEIHDSSSGSSTPMIGQADDATRDTRTLLATGEGGSTITEVANLWSSKWPVGRGVIDMDWGVGAYDRKLVTATPSGIVMVFDLEKQKYERDIRDGNSRPVNCVRFCPVASYCHMIMSGGADGVIRCFDLRAPNSGNKRQVKQSGAVTSLAFAPNDPAAFVSGWDDGSIKRFDWKVPGKSVGKAFGAHGSKSVMDLQWKSEDGEWLASAGADRTVQVWDMNQSWDRTPTPIHTLHTAHPIRRVAWRPNHPTELLVVPLGQPQSSSNSIDTSVPATPKLSSSADVSAAADDDSAHLEVWHVRRHYVAKYAVPSQDGVATDAAWKTDGELVVAFQNGGFAQLDVKGSLASGKVPLPLDGIPRQVVAWSSRGELVYALDRFKSGEIPFDDLKPEYSSHWEKVGRQPSQISDPPYYPLQAMGFLPLPDTSEDTFAFLAKQYRIEGLPPASLCSWNRDVANWCGREDDARLWGFAKVLIEEFAPELAGEGAFRQDVFTQQKEEEGKGATTPREISPTGSPGAAPAARLASGGDFSGRRTIPSSPLALSIPLRRLSITDESLSEDGCSSSEESSSGSSSFTDDESHAAAAHQRSKFVSFAEPDTPHPHERRGSIISSTGRPMSEKHELSISSVWDKDGGGGGGTGGGAAGKKSSLTKMTMTSARQQLASASDWPDPYGIVPEPTPAGTASRASTRSSPVPTLGRNARDSPRGSGLALGMAHGAGVRGSDGEVGGTGSGVGSIGLGNGVTGQGPLGLGGVVCVVANGEEMRGKEERFEKREWDEYRKRRIRGLMSWWEGCIDGGEMQLATTLAIVASPLTPFPCAQTERLAHAYIETLESHRLPLPAAYIRRHAAIPSLEITALDQGMTHSFHCQRCGKSTGSLEDIGVEGKVFWWCKRCRLDSKCCAVCRRGVRGLWMGCRLCNHGGHQKCMRLYHATAPLIPYTSSNLHSHSHSSAGQLRPRSPSQGTNPASSAINASSVYASAISGYTLSTTEVSGGTEYTGGGEKAVEFRGGWGVCPTGCGCRCRRVSSGVGVEA